MAFQFESDEFKYLFKKIERICVEIINSPQDYDSENFHLASAINTASHIFNTNLSLAKFDEYIVTSRKKEYFDFVNELSKPVEDFITSQYVQLDNPLKKVASLLYIYLFELRLKSGIFDSNESVSIGSFRSAVDKIILVDDPYYKYIDFAKNDLNLQIIQDMLKVSKIKSLNDLDEKILEAKTTLNQWDEKLADREKAVVDIELKLKNIKQQYDFVLLNKGFKDLYEQKKINLEHIRDGYGNFGALLILTPVVVLIILIIFFIIFGKEVVEYLIYIVPPVTTFMIMMFYFARVMLQDKRALQSQMIQIELRMALCQFIHNYAEETESLHKKNEKAFEKFESLIFSPIVSSDDNIPSTIDGIDQLVRLVQTFKGSK